MERDNLDQLIIQKNNIKQSQGQSLSVQNWFDRFQPPNENPDMHQYLLQNLKVQVNNFLYDKVHSNMTMKQFQKLSIVIYQLIIGQYQKHMRELNES